MAWPPWWEWELQLTSHLRRRMEVRGLTEVELRHMLHEGRTFRRDVVEGRWVIEAKHARTWWEVIVEPDIAERRLVVVTAYPVGR